MQYNEKPLNTKENNTEKKTPIILRRTVFDSAYLSDLYFSGQTMSEYVELSVVTKGSGIHKVLNETAECQTGDIYILNSGVCHGYYAKNENEYPTVLTVSFDPRAILSGKWSDSGSSHFCYGIFRDNIPISYAMLNSNSLNEVEKICESLESELSGDKLESYEASRAYLTLLLITVARYINLADTVLPSHTKEWSIVSAAIREIFARCCDDNMTLESIAASLYISKSHLSRLFQKVVGETFLDYVRKVRINKACNLLQDSSLTNEEIVGKCGIKDIPTFYRQFKAVTGMTPHQYRLSRNTKSRSDALVTADILTEISENLQKGKITSSKVLVENAINAGIPAEQILNYGLLHGMNAVADRFKNNEVYVPTVLAAAKAMNLGMETLKPFLIEGNTYSVGKVCIGTVRGDLHDIGKNLVKIMMEGKGLEVIDLGTDVAPEDFISTAIEQNCKVICCSALLTTTMGVMEEIVEYAKKAGIRDKIKILIGGAPVTKEFCEEIGADLYTPDAASAADAAIDFFR